MWPCWQKANAADGHACALILVQVYDKNVVRVPHNKHNNVRRWHFNWSRAILFQTRWNASFAMRLVEIFGTWSGIASHAGTRVRTETETRTLVTLISSQSVTVNCVICSTHHYTDRHFGWNWGSYRDWNISGMLHSQKCPFVRKCEVRQTYWTFATYEFVSKRIDQYFFISKSSTYRGTVNQCFWHFSQKAIAIHAYSSLIFFSALIDLGRAILAV